MTKIDKQREQLGLAAINMIIKANPDLTKGIFENRKDHVMDRIHNVLNDFQKINERKGKPRIFSKDGGKRVLQWGEGYRHRYIFDPSCWRYGCHNRRGGGCSVLYPEGRGN